MALANKVQLTYWGAAAAISGVVFWVLGDMLLPFLIGIAIAYFLDPAADILERWGLSRSLAVLAITLASLVILLPVLLFITTTLIGQLSALNNLSFSEEKIIEIEAQLKSILPAAIGESLDLRAQIETERTRSDYIEGAPNALVTQVFDAEPGTMTMLDDTDSVVLVRLDAVLPRKEDAELDGQMREAINAQATNDLSQDIFAAFASDLQTRIGFELDQQALNAVHAQFQ